MGASGKRLFSGREEEESVWKGCGGSPSHEHDPLGCLPCSAKLKVWLF